MPCSHAVLRVTSRRGQVTEQEVKAARQPGMPTACRGGSLCTANLRPMPGLATR